MRLRSLDVVLIAAAAYGTAGAVPERLRRGVLRIAGLVALLVGLRKFIQQFKARQLRRKGRESGLRVGIVGSGFAGLAMAVRCQELGLDFRIYESAETFGGTWRDNRYPGCSCDVPTTLYSFSFATDFDFSSDYVTAAEIHRYMAHVVEKFGLQKHMQFNTEVKAATWDPTRGVWRLALHSEGTDSTASVNFLVAGCGQLRQPKVPAFAENSPFKGTTMHTARFDHSCSLEDKRVAVVGTGATAIQLVPALAPKVRELVVFQRTPPYVSRKKPRVPLIAALLRQLARWSVFVQLLRRAGDFWFLDAVLFNCFINYRSPQWLRRAVARLTLHEMRTKVDADHQHLLEHIVPEYKIGAKRILLTDDWLETLQRDNVKVVPEGVERLAEDGLVTRSGALHQADVVVFATGFHADRFMLPMQVYGRNGRRLHEEWANAPPSAYFGLAVPGYPNMFHLYGPGTNLGHNSIVYMLEAQVEHIGKVLARVIRDGTSAAEVDEAQFQAYRAEAKKRMKDTVWGQDTVDSWYCRGGENVCNWYGSCLEYRKALQKMDGVWHYC